MSQQERATILLIDDHPMLRTGVKETVDQHGAGHPGDWRGQQWRARY